jgi:RNA polymerase sigma factor (sigma-70 family)
MLIEFPGQSKKTVFDEVYLALLRSGDEYTARHFDRHFRRLVRLQLWGRFSPDRVMDLIDDVMAAVIVNVMAGEPREAASLPAYVRGVCANVQKKEIKQQGKYDLADIDLERLKSKGQNPEQNALAQEKARAVWKVLSKLRVRHRNILLDLHYHGLERDEVCAKYGVTREQLRLILFHARRKFQQEWE